MIIGALALALVGAVAAALWFAREAREESRLAVANAMRVFESEARASKAVSERDAALTAAARDADALHAERAAHVETAQLYNAALEQLHETTLRELGKADPADVADYVARMLAFRRERQAAAAAADDSATGPAVAAGVLDGG